MSKKSKGKTKIFIYPDWCKGCGLCAAFCPAKVFQMDPGGKARVVNESECVNCGFCELHCPDFAIVVMPKEPESAPLLAEEPALDVAAPESAGSGMAGTEPQQPAGGAS